MALFSYIQQPGCVMPPATFTNLVPGSLVELHGWYDDETPTGGAVGGVTKVGDKAGTAWVRFVKAENGFWDWHIRLAHPNQALFIFIDLISKPSVRR